MRGTEEMETQQLSAVSGANIPGICNARRTCGLVSSATARRKVRDIHVSYGTGINTWCLT